MHPFTALFVALIFSAASFGLVPPCRAAAGSPADGVEIIPLGGTWDFAYTPEGADTPPDDGRFKTLIPVPGGWDDWIPRDKAHALWPDAKFNPDHAPVRLPLPPKTTKPPDASLPYLLGVGWHRRPIDVPEAWRGRRVVLRVGRTVMEASVWVNGRKVRHHLGHSVPWEVDLSPALEYGKLNELILAVDNRRDDRTGSVIQGYQGRGGGIFGPVSLKVSGPARIADFYVFEQDDRLVWRAELEGKLPQGPELHWAVVDSRDRTILGHGEEPIKKPHLEWTTDAFGIPFWSDDSPRLVEIRLELVDGERRLDSVHRSFGRRRLTCKDAGLRLNGRPVFLRGLCERAYFPETCSPPMDAAWYRRHVRNLKSLGFNWIRAHTWTLTEEYLQAADELGMMVQVEPPRGYQMPEWFDILRACRKHPSVVLYCAGDEETLDESKIEFLRKCADAMRAEVPDALFNPQEAMRGVEYALDGVPRDAISAKPFPHHPRRLAALREFSDVFGQYAWGWLSEDSLRGDPATIDRRLALYKRPCLSHEACAMDGYLDLSLESRYRGTRIGLDLYAQVRAALDKAGLLGRADRYYRCSAAWQRLLRKDVCETARRCGALAGYDLLGANDVHWRFSGCACGIMNEFDEIKHGGTSDNALRYNGPSVLLIDPQRRRNLSADEPFHRDVFVSWFGAEPLPPATTLRWYLLGADGTLYGRGQSRVPRVEPGQIARIGRLDADLAPPARPVKAVLRVVLAGPSCTIDNQWDYWLFPRVDLTSPDKNVLVTGELDDAARKRLAEGGRVVLLGPGPLPARRMSFQSSAAGALDGNLATVIERHPLVNVFPHDGYCDWQFADMLDGADAVQFNDLDVPFDPILEAVSSYKRIRKQAALFEWRVGPGRLLICGLNLKDSDPAAVYFRDQILKYAAGESFQPRTSVSPEQLAKLAKSGAALLGNVMKKETAE